MFTQTLKLFRTMQSWKDCISLRDDLSIVNLLLFTVETIKKSINEVFVIMMIQDAFQDPLFEHMLLTPLSTVKPSVKSEQKDGARGWNLRFCVGTNIYLCNLKIQNLKLQHNEK